jgi:hypothetical protein
MPWFAYYFPCYGEDLCKLGFSHDPLQRIRSLYRRWYEFFDLELGLLIETETERDARDIELLLRRPLRAHNAPMPLTIQSAAGGFTEWFRGSSEHVLAAAKTLAQSGYRLHAPASGWFKDALIQRVDLLFEWSSAQRTLLNEESSQWQHLQPLFDELDGYIALSIPFEQALPDDIYAWYIWTRRIRGMATPRAADQS